MVRDSLFWLHNVLITNQYICRYLGTIIRIESNHNIFLYNLNVCKRSLCAFLEFIILMRAYRLYFFIDKYLLDLYFDNQHIDNFFHKEFVLISIHNIISYILIVCNYKIFIRLWLPYLSYLKFSKIISEIKLICSLYLKKEQNRF